ncbi:M67 family metallopeptidase [Streptomyces sp. NPDC091215]|uniref:M67 family metallopeptidase n=1 Tax=Streptomyces sp. NPDC091215 TaxID=3155192 RepID=UPI0034433C3C
MLTLTRNVYDEIVDHALRDHPIEVCGVVLRRPHEDHTARVVRFRNTAQSPVFHEADSRDLYKVYRDMAERQEELHIVYHSHTASEAYPSAIDVELAQEPSAHNLIISTAPRTFLELRSFLITDGVVAEEDVHIMEGRRAARVSPPKRGPAAGGPS